MTTHIQIVPRQYNSLPPSTADLCADSPGLKLRQLSGWPHTRNVPTWEPSLSRRTVRWPSMPPTATTVSSGCTAHETASLVSWNRAPGGLVQNLRLP